jgi:hypothetical protein
MSSSNIDENWPRFNDAETEKAKTTYQGYNLPMIRLGDGMDYIILEPHPYYYNQPMVWSTRDIDHGPDLQDIRVSQDQQYPFIPFGED